MQIAETQVILEGLMFPECPRWHAGKLWFSDMYKHQVLTLDPQGKAKTVVKVPGQPAGLGWTPDGRLLVVSMPDKRLLRHAPEGFNQVADLSHLASGNCNDMVVDNQGRAYIGHFGYDLYAKQVSTTPAEIIRVNLDGGAQIVADNLIFPNGMVITPDGNTLIAAESFASRLTAFDIKTDGSLTGRRVWAQLEKDIFPDGICLDTGGAIWLANAGGKEVMRVKKGGELTHKIQTSNLAFACMLGGTERRTLFITTAATSNPKEAKERCSGSLETAEVDIPGAGLP
jgi:sugar lactone lactonase YvrE